jgi:hypothetical protein
MGIASLNNCAMQNKVRDERIGWTGEAFVTRAKSVALSRRCRRRQRIEVNVGLTSERLQLISQKMRTETTALRVLCHNLKERESKYSRLRHLVLGLGTWLFRYLLKISTPERQRPTLLLDFSDQSDSRLRAQSRWCYNRHYNNVLELYDRWNQQGSYEIDIEAEGVFAKKAVNKQSPGSDYSFLADHYLELAIRMGLSQPRSGSTYKHFELQPDTLRTLLLSVTPPQEVLEIGDVAPQLRETWGLVFGGCPDDRRYLREDGYSGIDEEDLFGIDRAGFISEQCPVIPLRFRVVADSGVPTKSRDVDTQVFSLSFGPNTGNR